jgi:polar amino acid transport system substrate-binding protein
LLELSCIQLTQVKTGKALTVLLVCLLIYSSCAFSKEHFTIGVQDFYDYCPYSAYKGGEYSGFNRELLDLFASSTGQDFEYKVRPIRRLYAEYFNEKFDFKYPDNPLWQAGSRENKEISYSAPVVEYIDGLMVKPENKSLSFADLKSISLLEGFTPPSAYLQREQEGSLKIIRTGSYERLLELVLKKRVDAGYFNTTISRHYLIRTGRKEDALLFAQQLPYIRSYRVLSSIKHPQVIEVFNRFMQEKKREIKSLKKKYGIRDLDG